MSTRIDSTGIFWGEVRRGCDKIYKSNYHRLGVAFYHRDRHTHVPEHNPTLLILLQHTTSCQFCGARDFSHTGISGTIPANMGSSTSLSHLYVRLVYTLAKWSIGSRIGNSLPYSGGVIARALREVVAGGMEWGGARFWHNANGM